MPLWVTNSDVWEELGVESEPAEVARTPPG